MKPVLVIGATGNVEGQVVRQLLEKGVRVKALTRRTEAPGLPKQVELLHGDLTDPECLDDVGEIDAVFLIWCAPLTAASRILEKLAGRVERIVFLSNMTIRDGVDVYNNRESTIHFEIERLITLGPSGWTFLRAGVFMNNARLWWAPQIRSGNLVRWPYGAARTAPIHERDIAAVAVHALLDEGHNHAKYVLTGPESLSHLDQVRVIGEVLGRPLRFEEVTPSVARVELFQKWPAPVVDMLLAAWPALVGTPVLITPTVEEVTGLPPHRFREWAQDHRESFQMTF